MRTMSDISVSLYLTVSGTMKSHTMLWNAFRDTVWWQVSYYMWARE